MRRLRSGSVGVTVAEDVVRLYTCLRERFAFANFLQPSGYGRARRDTFQLPAQELLHGLALKRGAPGQLIANFLRDISDRNFYRHSCIMPATMVFGSSQDDWAIASGRSLCLYLSKSTEGRPALSFVQVWASLQGKRLGQVHHMGLPAGDGHCNSQCGGTIEASSLRMKSM